MAGTRAGARPTTMALALAVLLSVGAGAMPMFRVLADGGEQTVEAPDSMDFERPLSIGPYGVSNNGGGSHLKYSTALMSRLGGAGKVVPEPETPAGSGSVSSALRKSFMVRNLSDILAYLQQKIGKPSQHIQEKLRQIQYLNTQVLAPIQQDEEDDDEAKVQDDRIAIPPFRIPSLMTVSDDIGRRIDRIQLQFFLCLLVNAQEDSGGS